MQLVIVKQTRNQLINQSIIEVSSMTPLPVWIQEKEVNSV